MSFSRKINLSYVLTTYNKLSYLKHTITDLIANCSEDEEIVVVDGGSKDGTTEFLAALFREGKIHQFISENDYGEGHGFNKAFLMAQGELIKIISDDDAYYYPGIKECKEFMLKEKEVFVLGTNGFGVNNIFAQNQFIKRDYSEFYKKWKEVHQPFIFCGLSLMFRKRALPVIGLIDNNFIATDFEWTLRITASKAKLAWYTGFVFINIMNEGSNSSKQFNKILKERLKLENFYFNSSSYSLTILRVKLFERLGKLKQSIFKKKLSPGPYKAIYDESLLVLRESNKKAQPQFVR